MTQKYSVVYVVIAGVDSYDEACEHRAIIAFFNLAPANKYADLANRWVREVYNPWWGRPWEQRKYEIPPINPYDRAMCNGQTEYAVHAVPLGVTVGVE